MKKPSGFGWNEAIQDMYYTDLGTNPCKEIKFPNGYLKCTLTEPIQELQEMSTYYSATNQTQAEGAIQLCQYIIGSVDQYGQFSIASTPAIHKVSQTAETEAKRLATQNPGKTFVVLQLNSGFRAGGLLEF